MNFFSNNLVTLGPGQTISTGTAVDIAKSLTLGILGPIASQIDPLLLGRVERSMKIANAYSNRLNRNFSGIKRLVEEYPSHEFVIDYLEAKEIFANVREPDADEIRLEENLRTLKFVPYPSDRPVVIVLSTEFSPPPETEQAQNGSEHPTNGQTEQPAAPASEPNVTAAAPAPAHRAAHRRAPR